MSTDPSTNDDDTPDPVTLMYPSGSLKPAVSEPKRAQGKASDYGRADLDRAKQAASLLTPEGMRELTEWIEVQLTRKPAW